MDAAADIMNPTNQYYLPHHHTRHAHLIHGIQTQATGRTPVDLCVSKQNCTLLLLNCCHLRSQLNLKLTLRRSSRSCFYLNIHCCRAGSSGNYCWCRPGHTPPPSRCVFQAATCSYMFSSSFPDRISTPAWLRAETESSICSILASLASPASLCHSLPGARN